MQDTHQKIRLFIGITLALFLTCSVNAGNRAFLVEVDGVIGPVTHQLIEQGIDQAESEQAALIILQINTPGGLDHSMREIIRAILDAHVAVITYVSPQGSRAASAGTYILYASHVAAMAPATNLGAATPVQIGSLPKIPSDPGRITQDSEADDGKTTLERKLINDATAYIRSLANLRGRNAEWAALAVSEAASLTAEEALALNVIDIVADDLNSLLQQLDGRELNIRGHSITLDTSALIIDRIQPDWRSQLLAIITNPNIAYVLLLIGIYGLILEFSNPGIILPGVTGSICLLLALYAFQVLPVNYAGLALLIIGLIFIVSELFVTSGGILGIGGVVAFTAGSIMLFDDQFIAVSLPMIGGTALVAAGFMLWILKKFSALRHSQVVSGEEYMIGREATVHEALNQYARVDIDGESWKARSETPLTNGQRVRVNSIDKLVLEVEPVKDNAREK